MNGIVEAPRAYWRRNGMARLAGVNLPAAVVDGWLNRTELARLVGRCRCGMTPDCTGWLATARAAPLPDFCRNKRYRGAVDGDIERATLVHGSKLLKVIDLIACIKGAFTVATSG